MKDYETITILFRGNIFKVSKKDFAYNLFFVVDELTGICSLTNFKANSSNGISIGKIEPNNIFNIDTRDSIFRCLIFDIYQPPEGYLANNHRKVFSHFDLVIEGNLYYEHRI